MKIVIACGGTGGHLFPGLAVAEVLRTRRHQVRLLVSEKAVDQTAATIERVQEWLDQPSANFGWIVIGNEATSTTTKRFDSREISPSDTRPSLTVDFTHP